MCVKWIYNWWVKESTNQKAKTNWKKQKLFEKKQRDFKETQKTQQLKGHWKRKWEKFMKAK